MCNGSSIPIRLNVGNCVLNLSNNILQWNINGTEIVQYDYIIGDQKEFSRSLTPYFIKTTFTPKHDDNLNIISRLQNISTLISGTSVSCGSSYIHSNLLTIPQG